MKAKEYGFGSRLTVNDWVFQVRTAIVGSMIANQVNDHIRQGKGAPDKADMIRFAEEAAAVADLWEEA
jgi:hypothetical protein